ncbi:heavy metal translocating P-type ATPase [Balneola sp. MJW-20]|uniref:heavy metal translocating P-type ATPase n=1 Tax=Gracilimonas aurantiaca TaxID=3234185 RepID=UPI00346702AC
MLSSDIVIPDQLCYHCGESCSDTSHSYDDKHFCCNGCQVAYKILKEGDLCTYYELDRNAGVSLKKLKRREKFDYLEDQEVIHKISDFADDKHLSINLYIPGIHCASCVWLLENLSVLDEGVLKSQVNFLRRELDLLIDIRSSSLRSVVELLTTIGYQPEIRFEKLDRTDTPINKDRSLWLKMGVAGFAFGNIMLFSFPDYLNNSENSLGIEFRLIFGALNILLALPVLLYSSQDYLRSAIAAIRQGGINLDVPISIGIAALFGRSLYEILSGTGAGYMDSFTGLIFFLLIGKMIEKKTFDRLSFDRDYRSYLPIAVNRITESGQEQSVSIDKLSPGLTIRLRNQELVPCDCILESEEACMDYSFITGESEPVQVVRGDLIYAGGRISGKSALLRTSREVENSYLTRLWDNKAFSAPDKEKVITSFADRISPIFTYTVLAIALTSGIWWLQSGMEQALSVFTAVLIIACPCALALSTPFTLGSTLNIFSLNGLFIRNSKLIESMANTDTIVFDKTGTLTSPDQIQVEYHGTAPDPVISSLLKGALSESVHPLSRSVAEYLKHIKPAKSEHYNEFPGRGIQIESENHIILAGNSELIKSTWPFLKITEEGSPVSGSVVHVAVDQQYLGYFEIRKGLRTGLNALIVSLKDLFRLYLLSGDNSAQAPYYEPYFGKDHIQFRQSPEDKLNFIQSLQNSDKHVMMVGDGLNDAGALKQSNFGIALSDDISSFSPACDAIIEGSALSSLNRFIDFSKTSMKIILFSFFLSLLYNITGLSFAVTGQLSPLVAAILMPLSSVSVMVFTFVTTRFFAKKMGLKIWK